MSQAWAKGSDTRWRAFRHSILDRDRWLCTVRLEGCTTVATQVDHIVPLSKGGAKYDPGNARAACAWCNTSRGNRAPALGVDHKTVARDLRATGESAPVGPQKVVSLDGRERPATQAKPAVTTGWRADMRPRAHASGKPRTRRTNHELVSRRRGGHLGRRHPARCDRAHRQGMSQAWAKGSDTRWRAFRHSILDRDRWLCTVRLEGCTTVATQVDHIVPLSKGGAKYDPGNARAACAWCNTSRGNRAPAPQPEPRPVSSW